MSDGVATARGPGGWGDWAGPWGAERDGGRGTDDCDFYRWTDGRMDWSTVQPTVASTTSRPCTTWQTSGRETETINHTQRLSGPLHHRPLYDVLRCRYGNISIYTIQYVSYAYIIFVLYIIHDNIITGIMYIIIIILYIHNT